jgi:hypothetical protein
MNTYLILLLGASMALISCGDNNTNTTGIRYNR